MKCLRRLWPSSRRARARRPSPATLRSGKIGPRTKTPAPVGASQLAADRAMAALTTALAHADPDVRAQAVVVVSELADDRARRVLQAMMHDPSPTVRLVAIAAAGRGTHLDVVPALIVALGDPDGAVRRAAADAVARISGLDPHDVEALKHWWTESRVAELTGAASPACDTLLEIPAVPWRQST